MIAEQKDYKPRDAVRCDRCGSSDTLPMPVVNLMDRLRWAFDRAPFKCRKCRKKLYRKVWKLEARLRS